MVETEDNRHHGATRKGPCATPLTIRHYVTKEFEEETLIRTQLCKDGCLTDSRFDFFSSRIHTLKDSRLGRVSCKMLHVIYSVSLNWLSCLLVKSREIFSESFVSKQNLLCNKHLSSRFSTKHIPVWSSIHRTL